ncbi:MAG: hypothetical protein KIT36_02680 [Alphaproteobacteria bacterium]|nr:hypothetical protein [Alphaproteobacteria bacterium]
MLRNTTLSSINTAMVEGDVVVPSPDVVRAIEREARQLRAQAVRDAFRAAFTWLFRTRPLVLPAGRVDVVRGH